MAAMRMSTTGLAPRLSSTAQGRSAYELPAGGISLTEWVTRRLHKTELLSPLAAGGVRDGAAALAHVGLYAVAASSTYGPARYQPRFDAPGRTVDLADPATGAHTHVVYEGQVPHYRFSFTVDLDGVGTIHGTEEVTGTTVGLRGLGMPAPTTLRFTSSDGTYTAEARGIITSELAPRLGTWQIRAFGTMQLRDSVGNQGEATLQRDGRAEVVIRSASSSQTRLKLDLTA